jgi:hypothetical protein
MSNRALRKLQAGGGADQLKGRHDEEEEEEDEGMVVGRSGGAGPGAARSGFNAFLLVGLLFESYF